MCRKSVVQSCAVSIAKPQGNNVYVCWRKGKADVSVEVDEPWQLYDPTGSMQRKENCDMAASPPHACVESPSHAVHSAATGTSRCKWSWCEEEQGNREQGGKRR